MSQTQHFAGHHYKSESHPLPPTVGGAVGQVLKPVKKKAGVAFDDEIPNNGPEVWILRVKGSKSLTFTIWGNKLRGIWIHWAGDGSIPHFRDEENCPGCLKNQERRWKGFLHCYCSEMRQEVFLELTKNSARSLRDQLGHRASMRGAVIQVKRTTSDNGRLYISCLTPMSDTSNLPPEKDPRPSILALWGVSEEDAKKWLAAEAGSGEDATFK